LDKTQIKSQSNDADAFNKNHPKKMTSNPTSSVFVAGQFMRGLSEQQLNNFFPFSFLLPHHPFLSPFFYLI